MDFNWDVIDNLIDQTTVLSSISNQICKNCGKDLGDSNECILCINNVEEAPPEEIKYAQLRIVGTNSSAFQSDMFLSNSLTAKINSQVNIKNRYIFYYNHYLAAGGSPFPVNAFDMAALEYDEKIRAASIIIRGNNKNLVMAFFLYKACIALSFSPNPKNIETMLQLEKGRMTLGQNYIRDLISRKKVDIDVPVNTTQIEINTEFGLLGYGSDDPFNRSVDLYAPLKEATLDMIDYIKKHNIGISAVEHTKNIGCMCIVLMRTRNPKYNLKPVDLNKFSIKRNTLFRFITDVNKYHKLMIPIYEKHGLITDNVRL